MDHQLKWLFLNSKAYKKARNLLIQLKGNRQITISPSGLLLSQHQNGVFNRYDVVVRLMAIEEIQGAGNGGMALYHKMQKSRNQYLDSIGQKIKLEDRHDHKQGVLEGLITSFRQQGFDAKNPISVTSELKLVDGSHRLACALYFNSNPVLTTRAASKAVDFGLDWFSKYFEPNELEVIKARYNELLQNIDIGRVLSETLVREKQVFGRGQFYQSSEELNITGQRPTSERYRIYGLKEFLDKDQSVLDIGCNCGFFTLKIAKEVKSAVGIEITGTLVSVAQTAQVYLQRPNVEFVKGNFNDHKFGKKFDFICSFAVHYWLGADMKKYGQRLLALLNPQGLVLLESQNIEKEDQDWEDKLSDFKSAGFVEIRSGTLKDDGVISRRFTVLRRN